MSTRQKVIVIGAGPGGLAVAMQLSGQGYDVHIYEKAASIGGRTALLKQDGFSFDLGPTALNMPNVITTLFADCGRNIRDYVNLISLDPLYSLHIGDIVFNPSHDSEKTKREIARLFPGEEANYDRFMHDNAKKMVYLLPIWQEPFTSLWSLFSMRTLRALPSLTLGNHLIDELSKYFEDRRLRLAFSFETKFLGMSPWETPGAFSVIPFAEHYFGVFHIIGGINQLTHAMSEIVQEKGGEIHLNQEVTQIHTKHKEITSITLANGDTIEGDYFFLNADYAYTMSHLFSESKAPISLQKLARKKYSCSGFAIYLGLDITLPLNVHTVLFPDDFRVHMDEIMHKQRIPDDLSIHISYPTAVDRTMAPRDMSALRILVPVPNNESDIDWEKETQALRRKTLDTIERKLNIPDLESHILTEKIITPYDWENDYHIYKGAIFNLTHQLSQLGPFRPSKTPAIKNMQIVGGATHPANSLPFILESANIAVRKFNKEHH
ncbi:NAD(P)/FAD-dependent oxidoreductase [Listeria booriae]|uniref:Phytoene desaturase n=1 Tax=Listeria booriae TaxID=1552123 RepID=A0A7X1A849_9LIST|nr:phytoene desaturase family protein [Listeria booriae]MBC2372848.1 phytoene desaturase [Listeria booriae]STY42435.1 Dehydrosqualene desaturase [Listeria booriae]